MKPLRAALAAAGDDPLWRAVAGRTPRFWLELAFALSGAAALCFQVLWTRHFSNLLGATAPALAAVLAAFVVALAAGAAGAVRWRATGSAALRGYAALELAIAASAWLVSGLLWLGRDALPPLLPDGPFGAFAAAFAALVVPCALMGATLPVALAGWAGAAEARAQGPRLYGANAAGAAAGALACGFVLLWKLGVTGAAHAAAAMNLGAAGCAWLAARRWPVKAGVAAPPPPREAERPLMLALAFLSGLLAFCYELLWGRLAKLYLGDRTIAVATLLAVVLLWLAAGAFAAGPLARRLRAERGPRSLLLIGAALAVGGVSHLIAARAALAVISGLWLTSAGGSVALRVAITLLLCAVPVATLGLVFPLLLSSSERLPDSPSASGGALSAVNAAGCAAGALLGGWLLPSALGTPRAFAFASGLAAAVAAALFWSFGRGRWRSAGPAAAAAAWLAGAALLPAQLRFAAPGDTVVASHEDDYGVQLLLRDGAGRLRLKSNRVTLAAPLGDFATSYAQESIAWFSCLLADQCGEVLNIGTGYGITAGAFTLFDSVRRVTTVEILPFVLRLQPAFAAYNFSYGTDPRVRAVRGDGRRLLAGSPARYDVITVNVLDPYLPGSSSLFTVDFWELARSRLSPGGVYAQLVWGPDLATLVAGLRRVFPRVLFFPAYGDSYNVVAFADDPGALRWRLERLSPKARAAFRRMGVDEPRAFLEVALQTGELFARRLSEAPAGPLHSDDRPVLELRWRHRGEGLTAFDSLQTAP